MSIAARIFLFLLEVINWEVNMDSWETKYALLNIQFNMLEMENDRLKEENRNLWNRINSLEQFIKAFGSVEMNSKFEIWNKKEET